MCITRPLKLPYKVRHVKSLLPSCARAYPVPGLFLVFPYAGRECSFLVSLKRTSLKVELYIVFQRFPRLLVSLFIGGYSLPSLSRILRTLNFIYHTSCLDGMMTRIGYVWSIKCSGGFHCWVITININFSILAPRKLVLLYSSPSPGRTSSRNLHKDEKKNKIGLKLTPHSCRQNTLN